MKRQLRVVQEIRECQSEWVDDYFIPMRRGRINQLSLILWDWLDWGVNRSVPRSWKKHRKTQYKVKVSKPKKDSSNFAKAMSKRDHFDDEHWRCAYPPRRCKHCWKMGYWEEYDKSEKREWKKRIDAEAESWLDWHSRLTGKPPRINEIKKQKRQIAELWNGRQYNLNDWPDFRD